MSRKFDMCLVGLLLVCLALSLARSAFVVLACQFALCAVLLPRGFRVRIGKAAAAFFLGLLIIFSLVSGGPAEAARQYVETFTEKGGTVEYYSQLNGAIWEVIPDAIWIGYGAGGLAFATADVSSRPKSLQGDVLDATYLHLSLLGTAGVIGLICFCAFLGWHIVKLVRTLIRIRRCGRFPSLELFLALAIVSVVGTWLRMVLQAVWVVLFPWFVLALACGIRTYAEGQLRSVSSEPRRHVIEGAVRSVEDGGRRCTARGLRDR